MSVISIIRSDFREYYIGLCNWFFYWRHSLKMNLAIRLADMKQKAFNKQYHVMLLEVPVREKVKTKDVNGNEQTKEIIRYSNKLVSVNREDINRFKRKKWIPKHVDMFNLKQTSFFYSTPLDRNNKSTPEERKAAKKKYIRYAKKYMRN